MREVKFRGKAAGTWYFGNLQTRKISRQQSAAWIIGYDESPMLVSVDPSTVGQFTGLLDKHLHEIYEGDIVKMDNKQGAYKVLFDWANTGAFILIPCGGGLTGSGHFGREFSQCKCEVIGNIHDKKKGAIA